MLDYKLGCACWLPGCILYLVPICVSLVASRRVFSGSDVLQSASMIIWLAGCCLPFVEDAPTKNHYVPEVNLLFLVGSAGLFLDAVRVEARTQTNDPTYATCVVELLGSIAFMLAGGMGGYCTDTVQIRFGLWQWLVGSVLYQVVALVRLYNHCQDKGSVSRTSSFYVDCGGQFPFALASNNKEEVV